MPGVEHTLSRPELARYVAAQFNAQFPDRVVRPEELEPFIPRAMERLEHCFSHIRNKYFYDGNTVRFDHLHTDQYAVFLYYLSNTIFRAGGDLSLASKAYGLNKTTLGLEIFYEVALPDVFFLQHPVGTVLGRATYSDFLLVWQRAGTGMNIDNVYPTIGRGVVLFGNSTIIGDCQVGANTWLSYGSTLVDRDTPNDSVVFGGPHEPVIRPTPRNVLEHYFRGY